ncbi:MAG: hypothetical protein H0X38_08805 [Planctomycetes bacterium]|nr:hypothetical protein [Planctomycetota bacterium]
MIPTVLVTAPEHVKGGAVFTECADIAFLPVPADEAELAEAVLRHDCQAVIIGAKRYVGPLYAALARTARGRATLLARFGVGHDGVDKAQARALGILVTNTPGTLDASVAEHTFWLIGSLVRHVADLHGRFRAGEWAATPGTELAGRTLGLLGCGPIAQRVAAIARFGFGMRVLACGRRPRAELEAASGRTIAQMGIDVHTQAIDDVLQAADIVSLHLPSTPETARLIDGPRLARMRPGALFINTGRGALVDEIALHQALSAGALGGAGLDVFAQEPYQPADPAHDLRQLPNVVLTPHVASNTAQANRRMAEACVANLGHFFAGRTAAMTCVR